MKIRIITSLLPIFLVIATFGQSQQDSAILGSWQFVGYEMNGRLSPSRAIHNLSFFHDGVYQLEHELPSGNNIDSSSRNIFGHWKLERGKDNVVLSRTRRTLSVQSSLLPIEHEVVQLTDSLLVLSGYEGNILVLLHYHRIEELPRNEELHRSAAQIGNARQKSPYIFYLILCAGTRKPVQIKPEGDLHVVLKTSPIDTSIIHSVESKIEGILLDMCDSSITVRIGYEIPVFTMPTILRHK